jgi:hypothetical protein
MHAKLFVQKTQDGDACRAVEGLGGDEAVYLSADLAFAQMVFADEVQRPGQKARIGGALAAATSCWF